MVDLSIAMLVYHWCSHFPYVVVVQNYQRFMVTKHDQSCTFATCHGFPQRTRVMNTWRISLYYRWDPVIAHCFWLIPYFSLFSLFISQASRHLCLVFNLVCFSHLFPMILSLHDFPNTASRLGFRLLPHHGPPCTMSSRAGGGGAKRPADELLF